MGERLDYEEVDNLVDNLWEEICFYLPNPGFPPPDMSRHWAPKIDCPVIEVVFMVKQLMLHGDFQAEVYVDAKLHPPIYHYLITRRGEAEVLMWGQTHSLREARCSAQEYMEELGDEAYSAAG